MDDLEEFESKKVNFVTDPGFTSKLSMMDLMYDAIVENKMGALKHSGPILEKIEGVQSILTFFESIEDYEKCIELKKIINKLRSTIPVII